MKWYFRALDVEIEVPEVVSETKRVNKNGAGEEYVYELFKAGEWSFELPEEEDPEKALEAIGSWIAWYLFITKDKK